MKTENKTLLRSALESLQISFDEEKLEKLIAYHDLLMQQNALYNLTGHKDEDTSLQLNLLNSLAAMTAIASDHKEMADIGTGAGLPGIPWSILLPETKFFLIDSKLKKANFLINVAKKLELSNVTVLQSNVFELKRKFKTLVFQAFGKIEKVLQTIEAVQNSNGESYLFAASVDKISLELASRSNIQFEVTPFTIPFNADYTRAIIKISNK